MIGIHLLGGLGNQMFQYAAARVAAERLGAPLMVHGEAGVRVTAEAFDQGRIAAEIGEVFPAAVQSRTGVMLQAWREASGKAAYDAVLRELFPHHFTPRELSMPNVRFFETYDERFWTLAPGALLSGFFQSERYLTGAEARVRQWYQPAPAIAERVDQLARTFPVDPAGMACIHVRRGDYLGERDGLAHPTLGRAVPLEYYERALAALPPGLKFAVFSDDPDFTREHFRALDPWISPGESGAVDMLLMARCRYMVTANSSLSWWAGWLNPRADKVVIAPKYHIGVHVGRWYPAGIETAGWTYL